MDTPDTNYVWKVKRRYLLLGVFYCSPVEIKARSTKVKPEGHTKITVPVLLNVFTENILHSENSWIWG